ncbi:kinase [Aneurinibacillus migulanus]|uniref:aminoglycoside phosphotransferase family protein n=1 Tax=Aneurinibacillus migulanus TaxID=47500 RepID=UPI0005BA7695|nr:aminoglycoside phosphotransferase family protein [Aneurinibacillus migulanus]KIV56308.1 kinase [Aneurinibacillus migulanus]KPD06984.1 kinase [Aneurinibacillus migulanus]CEH29125.1 Aminoglycoside phosphotransferase [Aneurinibacillus migulanus]
MNKLKNILKEQYDIEFINVSPQQGGWSALAYKVFNNNHTYFLKVYEKSRASTPKLTALIDKYVPIMVWLLHNSGLNDKIPVPLLTKNNDYKCEDDDGIYLLYEYISGETIGDKNLSEEQVCGLSEIIAELHLYGKELPIETDAVKEDFYVPFLQQLRSTLDKEYNKVPSDVRELINPHIEQINGLIDTVEKLSVHLKNCNLRMALCHTDIHNWNLMQSGQQLMLIDWEGLKLAPVEADIMFLIDKPYYDNFLSIYQKVHKNFVVNPTALQFYQSRRKLEDIWDLIEQLIYDNQDTQERTTIINYLTKELRDINN